MSGRRRRGLAAAALLLLAGCAGVQSPDQPLPAGLAGTNWRAETLAGQRLDDETSVTLQFLDDGRIAGKAACNRYNGRLRVANRRLQVGPLASTRMACPPPLMEAETAFLASLETAQRFSRDNSALLLHSAGAAAAPTRFLPFTPP